MANLLAKCCIVYQNRREYRLDAEMPIICVMRSVGGGMPSFFQNACAPLWHGSAISLLYRADEISIVNNNIPKMYIASNEDIGPAKCKYRSRRNMYIISMRAIILSNNQTMLALRYRWSDSWERSAVITERIIGVIIFSMKGRKAGVKAVMKMKKVRLSYIITIPIKYIIMVCTESNFCENIIVVKVGPAKIIKINVYQKPIEEEKPTVNGRVQCVK